MTKITLCLFATALNVLTWSPVLFEAVSASNSEYLTNQFYKNCNTPSKTCVAIGGNKSQSCVLMKNCKFVRATTETSTDFVFQLFYSHNLRNTLCEMYKQKENARGLFTSSVQNLRVTYDVACKNQISMTDIVSHISMTRDPCMDTDNQLHNKSRGNLVTTTIKKTTVSSICKEVIQKGENVTSIQTHFGYHLMDQAVDNSCAFNPKRFSSISFGWSKSESSDGYGNVVYNADYSSPEIKCNFQAVKSGSRTIQGGTLSMFLTLIIFLFTNHICFVKH